MPLVLSGLVLLVASVAMVVGPQFATERIQHGFAVVCVLAAICILFRRHPSSVGKSNKSRDVYVGFSVLIPIAITGWIYNSYIDPLLGPDKPFDRLYSFLLWGVLAIASLPAWGLALRLAGIISPNEARSFQTWRVINQYSNRN